jgi:single-strand DNA-binding protein
MSNLKLETMSSSLRNRVTLIGNLGQDPQIKTLDDGRKVAHFTLATNDGFKNADGQKIEEATWHNIVAWNGIAETASKFLKKGREVALEGRIVYRTYEDKKGVVKNITEIVLNDFLFLQSSKGKTKEEKAE